MNFVRSTFPFMRRVPRYRHCALRRFLLLAALCLCGCSDRVRLPSPEQLAAFEEAGSIPPLVDVDRIQRAKLQTGPYRVVPGDVLEFTMPALLQAVTASQAQAARAQATEDRPYLCRVSTRGTVSLPAVGELEVANGSLAEIEEKVIQAYQRYVVLRPSVFVRVLEYKTHRVSILGAVAEPGVYLLRGDQMSLVALLMEAGGIVDEGAAVIRIGRLNAAEQLSATDKSAPVTPPAPARHYPAWRATFQPEGPLRTSGWLTVERGGEVLAHGWLDLGNAPQRQSFLGTAALRSGQVPADALQMRLSRLATHLETQSGSPEREPAALAPGWEGISVGQFVTELPAVVQADHDVPAPLPRTTSAANDPPGTDTVATLVLPVRGFNIPFRDAALKEGDTVVVEHIDIPLFSVLGLVGQPGNFPYPPTAQYNLTQAIAFAGGLDPVANPRYATIYRLTKEGSIVRVPFRLIEDGEFTDAMTLPIRPGDVIAIEHTPRTRAKTMVHNLLRVNTGLYFTGRDLWNND